MGTDRSATRDATGCKRGEEEKDVPNQYLFSHHRFLFCDDGTGPARPLHGAAAATNINTVHEKIALVLIMDKRRVNQCDRCVIHARQHSDGTLFIFMLSNHTILRTNPIEIVHCLAAQ